MKTLVILGSARGDSNTLKAVKQSCPFQNYEIVDLRELRIEPYSYDEKKNLGDDFLGIAKRMQEADRLVFATPVHWYAMSGLMKNFFDRFSDLLSIHKPIGKSFKGKKTYLIAVGASPAFPAGFEVPFKATSEYFGMEFQSSTYIQL